METPTYTGMLQQTLRNLILHEWPMLKSTQVLYLDKKGMHFIIDTTEMKMHYPDLTIDSVVARVNVLKLQFIEQLSKEP